MSKMRVVTIVGGAHDGVRMEVDVERMLIRVPVRQFISVGAPARVPATTLEECTYVRFEIHAHDGPNAIMYHLEGMAAWEVIEALAEGYRGRRA